MVYEVRQGRMKMAAKKFTFFLDEEREKAIRMLKRELRALKVIVMTVTDGHMTVSWQFGCSNESCAHSR